MAILTFPNKDPQEVLDYTLDWSNRLAGDAILTSSWVIADGDTALTVNSNSFTASQTTIWLSAGTVDASYLLTNHIVTQGGRTMEQSVKIKIRQK